MQIWHSERKMEHEDHILVWLDGKLIGYVEEADADKGYVLQWEKGDDGYWKLIRHEGDVSMKQGKKPLSRIERVDTEN